MAAVQRREEATAAQGREALATGKRRGDGYQGEGKKKRGV